MKALQTFSFILVASALFFGFSACEDEPVDPMPGEVKVAFNYVFGANALPWAMNQTMVHPKTKDTLTFTEFSFYLSNVRLQDAEGNWWSEEESYHLICAKCPEASTFTIKDVPAGAYTAMDFILGVDSARNVSGAQTGDLDPAKGMFWDWTNGYIMLKAEGQSPNSPTGAFTFHLGGNSAITPKALGFFGESISVSEDATPELTLRANPARLWHSSPSVSQENEITAPSQAAGQMANDFFINISLEAVN